MTILSNNTTRKFIDTIDLEDWEVETDTGWADIKSIHKTIEYQEYIITLESGLNLVGADTHILFDENLNEIYIKDCVPTITKVMTKFGPQLVSNIELTNNYSNMYDLSLNDTNHRFYTNDILSHNSTVMCSFMLWYILFHSEKTVALLANKAETAQEILGKVQLAYEHLPKWLQQGVVEWNKRSIELENKSRIIASATSASAIRGFVINLLCIDEAAFIENWEEFFTSVFPTISSGKSTKIILVSTPNGLNHYYKLWNGALNQKNNYNPILVHWKDVPGRDEKWKEETLAAMGNDIEKFEQEYCVEFLGSSGTLIAGWKLKELFADDPLILKDNLYQYELPHKKHEYCIVADTSRGRKLDYSAFHVIDITQMPYKQVCTFRSNETLPADYAAIIYHTAKLYNNAMVLGENNDLGQQVLDILFEEYEYEYILYTAPDGKNGGKKVTLSPLDNSLKGVVTTRTNKKVGCANLKLLIEQNQLIIRDQNTISELATFSKKNDTYVAEEGCHDDLVMGLVLFSWLTAQTFFKEYVEINTIEGMKSLSNFEMEESLMPFGIYNASDFNVDDSNHTQFIFTNSYEQDLFDKLDLNDIDYKDPFKDFLKD